MNTGFIEYKTVLFIEKVLQRQLQTYRDKLLRQQKDKNCTSMMYEETLNYCNDLENAIKAVEKFK